MMPVEVVQGDGPVILGLPHTGTFVPPGVWGALNDTGRALADTDWHIHRLYDGLLPGVTTVRATFHRYVIDANRDPTGQSLYPGQNTTGLVPVTDFEGRAIWHVVPDAAEVEARRLAWHAPYHAALAAQLGRVRDQHGVAVLYDCHSIRSRIPFLFEGRLPDLNIGTDGGVTCAPEIEHATLDICSKVMGYTAILNGRFTGGWTTRHYGRPAENIHVIQMELAQSTHLATEAAPFDLDPAKAEPLRAVLGAVLTRLQTIALERLVP